MIYEPLPTHPPRRASDYTPGLTPPDGPICPNRDLSMREYDATQAEHAARLLEQHAERRVAQQAEPDPEPDDGRRPFTRLELCILAFSVLVLGHVLHIIWRAVP